MTNDRDVVYVERAGGGAFKWLLFGAVVGAGLALLFAPKSGREMRRDLGKSIKGLRDLADETLEEFRGETDGEERDLRAPMEGGRDVEAAPRRRPERPSVVAARDELERRLAAARARRRQAVPEDEEPVA